MAFTSASASAVNVGSRCSLLATVPGGQCCSKASRIMRKADQASRTLALQTARMLGVWVMPQDIGFKRDCASAARVAQTANTWA